MTTTTLYAQLEIGCERYVLSARRIARILPLSSIRAVPGVPPGVVGTLVFRATPIPVADLTALAFNRPCAIRLSTRILVVTPFDDEPDRLLGLIAERVTHTLRLDDLSFIPTPVQSQRAAYLGPLATVDGHLVQRIEVDKLLPRSLFESLHEDLEIAS
jgi:chemotaxis-related protein WspB